MQIADKVMEIVEKKNTSAIVPMVVVKNHLWVFVRSMIEKSAFDPQTRESILPLLKPWRKEIGSTPVISKDLMKKISKCGLVDNVTDSTDVAIANDECC